MQKDKDPADLELSRPRHLQQTAMQRGPLIRKQPRGAAWVPDLHEGEHNEMVVVLCRLVWGRFVHSSDDRHSQQPVHLPEEIECGAPCTGFQEDLNQRK